MQVYRLTGKPSGFGVIAVVAAFLVGSLAWAQQPAAQQPAAQQPAQGQQQALFVFSGDAGLFVAAIKPDKAADFEMLMGKLKEGLAKSDNPVRKQQAAGWKVFKAAESTPDKVLYVLVIDPVVKDADYTPLKILYEAYPAEAQDLLAKWTGAFTPGSSKLNLQLVSSFAP
jgi:hypothetical protein